VNSDPETVDELLSSASIAAPMEGYPQVLITMTARVRRLSWKYSGLPYRIMLIDVGVLCQTLYLVCTAMRLAPCALGAVNGELAARAFDTDWRSEPGVAQFIVGRAVAGNRRLGLWQPVNDGQWTERARALLSADGSSPAPVGP
jgi:SagB-type dehydrogenase family enzyme